MKYWDFEKPIIELENKIDELKKFSGHKSVDLKGEVDNLEDKLRNLEKDIYTNLSSWQKVQIARHPKRPTITEYIDLIMKDFVPLCGDRLFSEDRAIICGFAKLEDKKVAVIGHQKGKDTKENRENCGLCTGGCVGHAISRQALRSGGHSLCLPQPDLSQSPERQ